MRDEFYSVLWMWLFLDSRVFEIEKMCDVFVMFWIEGEICGEYMKMRE